jgi:hypothetical protein
MKIPEKKLIIFVVKYPFCNDYAGRFTYPTNMGFFLVVEGLMLRKLYYAEKSFFSEFSEYVISVEEYEINWTETAKEVKQAVNFINSYIEENDLYELQQDPETEDFLKSIRDLFTEALNRGTSIYFFF